MTGCTQILTTFSEPNITGYVVDNSDESVLIVSNQPDDYSSTGGIEEFYDAVIASNAPDNVEVGDYVEAWYDGGIDQSYPAQATIGTLSILPNEQPEGADLTESEALKKALSQYSSEDHPLVVNSISYNDDQNTWSIVLENQSDDVEYSHEVLDE